MADVISLHEARSKKAAKAESSTDQALARRFEECVAGMWSIWEATLTEGSALLRDEQLKALINLLLEPYKLSVNDTFLDEVSRIEQALGIRVVSHYPETMRAPGYTNPGYVAMGFCGTAVWSTPPFIVERLARWFNVLLYLKLVEDGLAPRGIGR